MPGFSALIVSSGTSTSTRGRGGQSNSLNVIRIEPQKITIDRRVWAPDEQIFDLFSSEEFHRSENGWIRG
jgi:hypothetical protein